ncbi:MAG: stage V sporulation protein AC [Oscillospiraceae bacterium]|nr:stage V sporulation protein AC [Oscillospiraceae bacterium]
MRISNEEYSEMINKTAPKSPIVKDCIFAFLFGGGICAFGEVLRTMFLNMGASEDNAKTYVCLTLIAITAILTGIGVFDKIAKIAGAGTIVPITGFANSVVAPAMEFQTEGRIMGTGANMFKLSGPVIVYGCSAAVIYGVIAYLFKLY